MQLPNQTTALAILLALLCIAEVPAQTPQWPVATPSGQYRPTYPTTNARQLPQRAVRIAPTTYPATDDPALGGTWGPRYQIPAYHSQLPQRTQATPPSTQSRDGRYPQTGLPNRLQRAGAPPKQDINRPYPQGNSSNDVGQQRSSGTFGASMFPVRTRNETRSAQMERSNLQLQTRPGSDTKPDAGSSVPETKDAAFGDYVFCSRPYWEVDVDLVGLRRRKANDSCLITDQTSGAVVVDTLDLDFDYKLGFHADLIHQSPHGWGWEIECLGIPSWDGSRAVAGDLQLHGPGFAVGANPVAFSVDYSSSLYSVELNARQSDGYRWACYAGLRYIRFNDDLFISELNTPLPGVLDIDTENNLYGLQFGGDLLVYDRGGPLNGSVELKVGVYGNDVRQRTRTSLPLPAVTASAKRPLLAGEIEFLLTYKLSPRWKVRGSYKLVGLGSVALAPDQIGATDLSTGRAAIHYNSLLLDGGLLGVEYVW